MNDSCGTLLVRASLMTRPESEAKTNFSRDGGRAHIVESNRRFSRRYINRSEPSSTYAKNMMLTSGNYQEHNKIFCLSLWKYTA